MIPENDPSRCPCCGGIHLAGGRCPAIPARPITDEQKAAMDQSWRAFLLRLRITAKWT